MKNHQLCQGTKIWTTKPWKFLNENTKSLNQGCGSWLWQEPSDYVTCTVLTSVVVDNCGRT